MDTTLEATSRDTRGKNAARRLRREGKVPAVVYGGEHRKGVAVAVDPRAVTRILHSDSGVNTLVSLALPGGGTTRVLMKEFQLDPITHELLHIDFYQVAMDKPITVTVPILLRGESRGVKQQGGLLDFVHREIEIECLPADIPENVEVDVSELMLGQSIRLRDIGSGAKWKAVSEPDTMLVHVVAPRAEEVAEPAEAAVAAGAAPAEPEVIKKGKAEKEEE
jgi:large subunit ribosomal protein L25